MFKTIVRSVVQEELVEVEKRMNKKTDQQFSEVEKKLTKNLTRDLTEVIEDKIEAPFLKYRNEIMTKLDGIAGSLKALHEENVIHQGKHDEIDELLQHRTN